jgi:peroxiredoxin
VSYFRLANGGYWSACLLALSLHAACLAAPTPAPAPSLPQTGVARAAPSPGKPAPDFMRTDLDGHPRQLRAYAGHVVLLNFWASWCEPCLAEIPRFSNWQRRYGARGLQVLGVAMDDELASVQSINARLHLAYPVILGDAPLGELYGGILGLPLSYLIDQQGRIVERYRGEPNLAQMESRINTLLSR